MSEYPSLFVWVANTLKDDSTYILTLLKSVLLCDPSLRSIVSKFGNKRHKWCTTIELWKRLKRAFFSTSGSNSSTRASIKDAAPLLKLIKQLDMPLHRLFVERIKTRMGEEATIEKQLSAHRRIDDEDTVRLLELQYDAGFQLQEASNAALLERLAQSKSDIASNDDDPESEGCDSDVDSAWGDAAESGNQARMLRRASAVAPAISNEGLAATLAEIQDIVRTQPRMRRRSSVTTTIEALQRAASIPRALNRATILKTYAISIVNYAFSNKITYCTGSMTINVGVFTVIIIKHTQ